MGNEDIITASKNGNVRGIQKAIESGTDVNSTEHFKGKTPLILASESGSVEAVKLLIEKGANLNAKADTGTFALMRASSKGYLEIVQLLIGEGADVNLKGEKDNTTLMSACLSGHLLTVEELLNSGAEANAETTGGVTPLMRARKFPDILKILLENGADINIMREDGKTVGVLAEAEDLNESLEVLGVTKGGCFVATACFDNYNAPEVMVLQHFRDNYLLTKKIGKDFVTLYYFFSPSFSKFLLRHYYLKLFVKNIFLKPIIFTVKFWR